MIRLKLVSIIVPNQRIGAQLGPIVKSKIMSDQSPLEAHLRCKPKLGTKPKLIKMIFEQPRTNLPYVLLRNLDPSVNPKLTDVGLSPTMVEPYPPSSQQPTHIYKSHHGLQVLTFLSITFLLALTDLSIGVLAGTCLTVVEPIHINSLITSAVV